MINRRKDPNFEQVTGLVPKDLSRRFKQLIAGQGLKISDGITEAIKLYLKQHEPKQAIASPTPQNIAELVQQNYYALLSDEKIKPDNLRKIAEGEEPNKADLYRIASVLDMEARELIELRDQTFDQSKRKEPNGASH